MAKSEASDPLIIFDEENVLVLGLLARFVQDCHHAVHERHPEVSHRQRVPKVTALRLILEPRPIHFEQLQRRRLEFELSIHRVPLKYLLELFESQGQLTNYERLILYLFSKLEDRTILAKRYQAVINQDFKILMDIAFLIFSSLCGRRIWTRFLRSDQAHGQQGRLGECRLHSVYCLSGADHYAGPSKARRHRCQPPLPYEDLPVSYMRYSQEQLKELAA